MLVNFAIEDITAALQSTLDGTCTYGINSEQAVNDTLFCLLANVVDNHLGEASYSRYSEALEFLAQRLGEELDYDVIWEAAWETWSGSGFDLCPICGWWGEDVTESLGGESVCYSCFREEEDQEL